MSELHYREELDAFDPSDWKVEMKCATIEEEEGVNIFRNTYVVLYGDFTYKYTSC